ncbi:hypothetical protein H5410_041929 [Solanum commersonii]|uniref:Uncharacterized protein n=1 Tax=Solanum commersonii TaxID=4109 RepID=A0A9J5XUZ4_SOLCO|nr:hypothetical protein H5410_041929 [Solanum commersonii]
MSNAMLNRICNDENDPMLRVKLRCKHGGTVEGTIEEGGTVEGTIEEGGTVEGDGGGTIEEGHGGGTVVDWSSNGVLEVSEGPVVGMEGKVEVAG